MNENSEKSGCRPWLWILLLSVFIVGFLAAVTKPNFIGGGPSKLNYIINNLRQIDGTKNEWAFERGFTNENQVLQLTNHLTEKDLFPYIYRNPEKPNELVPSVAGEIYTIGGFNTEPEAILTKKLKLGNETWPKGTVIRLQTDPASGMPYQVIFPGGTKKHFDISK